METLKEENKSAYLQLTEFLLKKQKNVSSS